MTSQPLEVPPEPSDKRLIGSAISWIGVILIFALIMFVAYMPRNEGPVDEQVTARRQSLADDVRRQEGALVQAYARNQDGTYRIPVALAMDLAPSQLAQLTPRGSSVPVDGRAAAPAPAGQQQAAQESDEAADGQGAAPADGEVSGGPATQGEATSTEEGDAQLPAQLLAPNQ